MNNTEVTFARQYRTPSSEGFLLHVDQKPVGRLDLHFGVVSSYATLIMLQDCDERKVLDIICEIDDQQVVSAETTTEEYYITVYRGEETGFYSDDHINEHRSQHKADANGSG